MARKPKPKNHLKDSSVLVIRNVPPEVVSALDQWIEELEKSDPMGATYSRMGIALRLIQEGLASRVKNTDGTPSKEQMKA